MKSAKNNYSTKYKYIQVPNKANLGIDVGAICEEIGEIGENDVNRWDGFNML